MEYISQSNQRSVDPAGGLVDALHVFIWLYTVQLWVLMQTGSQSPLRGEEYS